ncbi:MAG: hypothetical protein LAP21_08410 [Acidobacteriia bacterium]|nr:hypothetical protein [Terriglobia bacterium]
MKNPGKPNLIDNDPLVSAIFEAVANEEGTPQQKIQAVIGCLESQSPIQAAVDADQAVKLQGK